jgi:molybdate transport system substrate-binding protein
MIRTSSAPIIATAVLCLLFVAPASSVVSAAEIKVLAPSRLKPTMVEVIQRFEKLSGYKVAVDYGTVGGLVGRLQKGEAADVAISLRQQIAKLEKEGRIIEGSSVDIAKQGIGVFVRKGALKPDISSVENFKHTLLAVKSIAHADPARAEGNTARYVAGLLGRLDIAADIKPKITIFAPGVYDTIANGDVEIGFAGMSEIVADPRVELVGPLPTAIQNYTVVTAGIVANSKERDAAKALIQFISSPAASAVLKAKGYERP